MFFFTFQQCTDFKPVNVVLGLGLVTLSIFYATFVHAELDYAHNYAHSNKAVHTFKPILPDEFVSIGVVHAIEQDKKGFMWFGGQNGLARFDGYNLTIYRNVFNDINSLSNNYIWDILVDSEGRVWVATRIGISIFDYKTGKFSRLKKYGPNFDNQQWVKYGNGDLNEDAEYFTEAVSSLSRDDEGNIWFSREGAGFVRYHSDSGQLDFYFNKPGKNNLLTGTKIDSLARDKQGQVWIGTRKNGVFIYDPTLKKLRKYADAQSQKASYNQIRKLLVDSYNNVWIGTFGGGLQHVNQKTGVLTRYHTQSKEGYSLSDNYIWNLFEDREGKLWIATDRGGLGQYHLESSSLSFFHHSSENPNSPKSNSVSSVFQDRAGDLWVGYSPSGVDIIHSHTPKFINIRHSPHNKNSLSHNEVLSLEETHDGGIWAGTQNGLTHFPPNQKHVIRYTAKPDKTIDDKHLPADAVLSILEENDSTLWVGTWGGGLSRFDRQSKTFKHFSPIAYDRASLSDDRVWKIYQDSKHDIWIGTERGGLNKYLRDSQSFIRFEHMPDKPETIQSNMVTVIFEDSHHNFWIGTNDGLDRLDRESGVFTHFSYDKTDPTSLSEKSVKAIFEDAKGRLWIGTRGGGLNLFNREREDFTSIRHADGLIDDVVTGIIEDNQGFLWISTHRGLTRYDPEKNQFKNYNKNHGLAGNLFWRNTAIKLKNGQIAFGSTSGFTIINPEEIKDNTFIPPVVITEFTLANQATSFTPDGLLHETLPFETAQSSKHPPNIRHIILNHKQSIFSFKFSALNYRFSENNHYAFRLKGFENNWRYVGKQRTATYTNLDAGEYLFQVKASNDEGLWNNNGAEVKITVLPPIWQTWWAYTIYIVAIVLFIYFIFRYQLEKRTIKHLQDLDKLKDEFLANTSHELRTPLNGIVGLTDAIINGDVGPVSFRVKDNLKMILASGKRLSNLINDILDVSKLKEHTLELNQSDVDVYTATDIVLTLSKPLVKSMSVSLVNRIDKNLPPVYADENRFQQVLYNLIGNAIKFTEKGRIEISASQLGTFIQIEVKDTGIGIANDKLDSIFQSYEQADTQYGGTGLGLSVSKQLIELQGGAIRVESQFGSGSTFIFTLPISTRTEADQDQKTEENSHSRKNNVNLDKRTSIENSHLSNDDSHKIENSKDDVIKEETHLDDEHHILIVEDDHVNRMVIHSYLSTHYKHVHEAINGADALNIIREHGNIHIVLLDVMMPVISGYKVCEEIRKTYSAESLPVIFLTGLNQSEVYNSGYEAGGNDFLPKPILRNDVLNRVSNQLKLRKLPQDTTEA